jgi:flagellar basal body-associated protein FliL
MSSFSGSTSSHGNAPKRKSRQGRRNIMLILLVLGLLLAVIGYGFWRSEPAYWKRNQQFLQGRDIVTLLQIKIKVLSAVNGALVPAGAVVSR